MRFTRITIASVALAAGTGGLVAPAASGSATPAAPAAQYQVTLKMSAKQAVAKVDTVKLSGAVIPRPPADSKVVIQVRYEKQKAWKKAGTAPVKPNGSYKFLVEPESHLDRDYRVVKRADDRAQADTSRERRLDVTAWSWLTRWVPSAGENVLNIDKLPINGETYSHTLFVPTYSPTGFTEFTLGRNCTQLETTIGLSDRTETGGRAAVQVMEDGVVAYVRHFGLGESELKLFDVSDVYRVRIDFAQELTTPVTEPAAGAARVLCD
jgi:hypothetical protein